MRAATAQGSDGHHAQHSQPSEEPETNKEDGGGP